MTDRPIIFSAPTILSLLAGRKTMTRRIIKPQPALADNEFVDECHHCRSGWAKWTRGNGNCDACTCREVKGIPVHSGARRWVRETFSECPLKTYYRATEIDPLEVKWISPRFMPRAASRLTLEVTGVKVERVQEISEEDAIMEGSAADFSVPVAHQHRVGFITLWNSIYDPGAWERNEWVYALTFNVHKCNIDAMRKLHQ